MLDRRDFLRSPACWVFRIHCRRPPSRARASLENPFTLGVASGYPQPDGMVLWTRLVGRPRPSRDPGALGSRQGRSDAQHRRLGHARRPIPTGRIPCTSEPRGLEPDRWYFYRFLAGDAVSPVGRTRTAPAPDATAPRLRFALRVLPALRARLFFRPPAHGRRTISISCVFLGDYIYESSLRRDQVRMHETPDEPVTLEEYRARHALYKSDEDLQSAHRALPWIVTWDDHEVDNDYANDRQEDGAPPEEFLLRRAAAYRAYYEHMPLPARMRPNGPRMPHPYDPGLGHARQLLPAGRPAVPLRASLPGEGGRRERRRSACNAPICATRRARMLGAAQEAWLDRQFAASRAPWNIVAQQTLMAQLDVQPGEGQRFWTDGWDGYPAARRRLLESMAARRLANPVVIGGDVHMNFVADLKLDFDDAKSPVVASEFVGTLDHLAARHLAEGPAGDPGGKPPHQVRPRRPPRLRARQRRRRALHRRTGRPGHGQETRFARRGAGALRGRGRQAGPAARLSGRLRRARRPRSPGRAQSSGMYWHSGS